MEEVEEIGRERKWLITWGGVVEELKEASYIAAPMVAVTVLQYQLQVVSVIIVGDLGQLALSGVSLATSNNVTGSSLLRSYGRRGKEGREKWAITWEEFVQELRKECYIAAPMVAVSVLQYLLQVVSVIIVGHLGALALSSAAIATSITNVTGFSLLSGMVGGLETLSGQAYGAKQYQKLGTYTYSAIISLIIMCPPICVLWIFIGKLLPLLGQDILISQEACKYSMWLIPALFGGAVLKPLTRYLQTQSVILPMLITSSFILCLHTISCWTLVYKLRLGQKGAAIAFCLSTWLNVIIRNGKGKGIREKIFSEG